MPIAPQQERAPAAKPGDAPQGAPQQSFRERKAAELAAEREPEPRERQPESRQTRQERTPSGPTGSTDNLDEDSQEVEGDEEYEGEEGELFDDPDDGAPDDDSDLDDPEETHDWRKRYEDQQAELTRLYQERDGISQEHAEAMGETLRLKFDLEDRFEEAVGRAEYMANVMSGNAQQYRNINWSQVPAEQLPQVQAQAQQALAMEQQAKAAWEEIKRRADETKDHVKKREAEIAKIRLKRTIPNWGNETYQQLRQFAVSQGMDARRFNDETDPVVIEALNALMVLRTAGNKVQSKSKRKAQAPRGKTGRKPRDSRGRFQQIVPNQKGSFAEKARARLEAERRGR